jgi:membrane protein DedA with SNARE-associated domain
MGKKKYFTFLLISCLIWATICTYGGYFFGATLKNILGNIKEYELPIALGFLVMGFIIWFVRDVRKKRNISDSKS